MFYPHYKKHLGALGITVMDRKTWGCWAGFIRSTPPIFFLTPVIPKEPTYLYTLFKLWLNKYSKKVAFNIASYVLNNTG
jgi:hypothetical protein